MEYEDEQEDSLSMGLNASGAFDENASKSVLYLEMNMSFSYLDLCTISGKT